MDLEKAEKELLTIQAKKEELMPLSRQIVIDCAKAIRRVHTCQEKDVRKTDVPAIKKKLAQLAKATDGIPPLFSLLSTPYQEYAELEVLLSFVEAKPLPVLDVPAEEYVLGTLDGIGEAKRVCMDLVAQDRLEDAEKFFKRVEDVYYSMEGYAFPNSIVSGLKAKQDAMKRVLENMHAILVETKMRHATR